VKDAGKMRRVGALGTLRGAPCSVVEVEALCVVAHKVRMRS